MTLNELAAGDRFEFLPASPVWGYRGNGWYGGNGDGGPYHQSANTEVIKLCEGVHRRCPNEANHNSDHCDGCESSLLAIG